jgi:hypothetical protein
VVLNHHRSDGASVITERQPEAAGELCGRNKPNNDHVTLADVTGLIIYFSIALVIMRGAML